MIFPDVVGLKQVIIEKIEDFPAPLGPRSPNIFPA
jgi:hypothetical protein